MLSEGERTDARRFMGYGPHGADPAGSGGWLFYQSWGSVEFKLSHLSDSELSVMRTYLGTLAVLERALAGAGGSLDTAEAAGWVRNADELAERGRLFDDWRRRLCGFLGVPEGPFLRGRGRVELVV